MRGDRLSRKAYAPKKFGPMPPTVHPAKSPPTAPARNGHAAFHSAKANAFQSMSSFIFGFSFLGFLFGGASGRNLSGARAPEIEAASLLVCGRRQSPQMAVVLFSCQRSKPLSGQPLRVWFGTCSGLGYPLRPEQHVPSIIVGKRRGASRNSGRPEPPKGRLRPMFTGAREVFRLFSSCR